MIHGKGGRSKSVPFPSPLKQMTLCNRTPRMLFGTPEARRLSGPISDAPRRKNQKLRNLKNSKNLRSVRVSSNCGRGTLDPSPPLDPGPLLCPRLCPLPAATVPHHEIWRFLGASGSVREVQAVARDSKW